MRVHELAKALNQSSKELLEKLHKLGVKAKSHMSNLDEKTVQRLKAEFARPPKEAAAPKRKKAETPVPVVSPALPPAPEKSEEPLPQAVAVAEPIQVEIPITVGALAARLSLKISELIKSLMGLGVFANVNQLLSEEVVFKVSSHFGISIEKLSEEEEKKREKCRRKGRMRKRPSPVRPS
jgi:translation initiation factor IF-2